MKIGILDIDGHNFPNLALMKISSYHKRNGDNVEWVNSFEQYDRIYKSKIFTFTPDDLTAYQSPDIRKGGTGYDIKSKLPEEIDRCRKPDYSIYPQYPFSIQFYSRGCIRHCPFCLVHEKEGSIQSVEPMELNPWGKWIEVLDNNFFANPDWRQAVAHLKKCNQPVKFHGIDVRLIDEEQAHALNTIRLKGYIHIAWDLPQIDLTSQLKTMIKYIKPYKIACYVLIGFNSTREQDIYRIRTLKRLGILPFVQTFRDYTNKKEPSQYEKDISRWANRAKLFKSTDFMDYEPRKGFKCKNYFSQ